MRKDPNIITIFLFFIFTLISFHNIQAQNNLFSGTQVFGGREGTANYEYIFANGKSIMEGPFQFTAADSSFTVSGYYKNDRKDSLWQYIYEYPNEESSQQEILKDSIIEFYDSKTETISVERYTILPNKSFTKVLHCNYSSRQLHGNYYFFSNAEAPTEIIGIILEGYFSGKVRKDSITYEFLDGWLIKTSQDSTEENIIPTKYIAPLHKQLAADRSLKQFAFNDTLISIEHTERLSTYLADFSGIPQNVTRTGPTARYFIAKLEIVPITSDNTDTLDYKPARTNNSLLSSEWLENDIQNSINQAKEDAIRREREREERQRQREKEAKDAERIRLNREKEIDEIAQEIVKYHAILQEKCKGRNNRVINRSYESVIAQCDIVHTDTSAAYLNKLNNYLQFQKDLLQHYFTDSKIQAIEKNKTQIDQVSLDSYSDIAKSYKKHFKKVNTAPVFNSLQEFENHMDMLDTLHTVQLQYLQVAEMRKKITENESKILNNIEPCCKKIIQTYKKAERATDFTPNFNTPKEGRKMLAHLENFTEIQNDVLSALQNIQIIDENQLAFNQQVSKLKNIKKAYSNILKTLPAPTNFLLAENIKDYNQRLEEIIRYQKQFEWVLKTPTAKEINKKLRGVKDKQTITNIIGL